MPTDVNATATLKWMIKDVPHERHFLSLREAVRVAMKDLRRAEFFTAQVITADAVLSGDQIVEIFQTGIIAERRYAAF